MKAEIISVGTELLLGQILNTNAQFLAKRLAPLGIDLYYQTTVGDNPERLESMLRQALEYQGGPPQPTGFARVSTMYIVTPR